MNGGRASTFRVATISATAVLVVLGALIGTAGAAHKPRIASSVTISEHFDNVSFEIVFAGKVRSPRTGCRGHRTVKLMVVNRPLGMPNLTLGTDTSDTTGAWEIRLPSDGLAGDHVARVTWRSKPHVFCRSAQSAPAVPTP